MAHQVESLAYTGEKPWHRLGHPIDNCATPAQMQQAAGLDWQVERVPLTYAHGDNHRESGHYALIRTSDGQFLDAVKSDRWKPVQNRQAFEFFDLFVRAGEMTMEVAGALSGGRRVFALAKLKDGFRLARAKEDVTESYLLFTNPHIYGQSVDIRFTPVRVVCHNTLTLALGQKDNEYRVSFNHSREFVVEEAQRLLHATASRLDAYQRQADFLAGKHYRPDALDQYFRRIFRPLVPPRPRGDDDHSSSDPSPIRNVALARQVVEDQPGHEFAPGTWWNAFNAVTYLTDHRIGRSDETRLATAWYGRGKMRKKEALDLAMEYAKAA